MNSINFIKEAHRHREARVRKNNTYWSIQKKKNIDNNDNVCECCEGEHEG